VFISDIGGLRQYRLVGRVDRWREGAIYYYYERKMILFILLRDMGGGGEEL